MNIQASFKWRHFEVGTILLCVRWYLRYVLSYRDLEEMMAERGLGVDHATIFRWVQKYAPELDQRADRISKPRTTPGGSMKPASRSREHGYTCTEPWILKAIRLEFLISPTRDTQAAKW